MQHGHSANWIIQTMKKLQLPNGHYAVFGSGLLDVLGLKQARDIDVVVTKKLFTMLSSTGEWELFTYADGYAGLRDEAHMIELFYQSSMPYCSEEDIGGGMIHNSIAIDGVQFVRLADILRWKQAMGRPKDIRDVQLIEQFLSSQKKEVL